LTSSDEKPSPNICYPPTSDAEHLQQLGENILYWDGDGWQKKAVMNHRYMEASGKKD
jgi:hypothetical protein